MDALRTIRYWMEARTYERRNKRLQGAMVEVTTWVVKAEMVYLDGRTKRSQVGTFSKRTDPDPKAAAERELARLRNAVGKGQLVAPSKCSVGAYLLAWLPRIQNENTRENYLSITRTHIIPAIGHIELQALRAPHCLKLLDDLNNHRTGLPVADNTRRLVWAVLSSALSDALERHELGANPLQGVKRPRVKVTRQPTYWRKIDDLQRFLEVADRHQYGPFWRLAAYTGMREGELIPLKWRNIDLATTRPGNMAVVHVVEAVTGSDSGPAHHHQFTKGGDGYRSVLIDADTADALRAHRPMDAQPDDLVFPSRNGTLLGMSNVYRAFQRLILAAGVPKIRFHDLRVTHTTHALAGGEVSIKGMQGRMGWKTPAMVFHYAKLSETQDSEDAAKIFKRLDGR